MVCFSSANSTLSCRYLLFWIIVILSSACATMPTPHYKPYVFPKEKAFFGNTKRPYKTLGIVRSKVHFQTLDPAREETELCLNYFNKAVQDLVEIGKKQGADAVIDIKSVVFLGDGSYQTYPSAECSDDGIEGQVLTQGVAIQFLTLPSAKVLGGSSRGF